MKSTRQSAADAKHRESAGERIVARVKTASRKRMNKLAADGKALKALHENVSLLGINTTGGKPKIVSVGSYHFAK